jgi:hypothetical protein
MSDETFINPGWHDVEIVQGLAKPGRIWGDRTMTVQQWPSAQVGEVVTENGIEYVVIENTIPDGPRGRYAPRYTKFVRRQIAK